MWYTKREAIMLPFFIRCIMKRLNFNTGELIKDSGLIFVSEAESKGKRRVNVKCHCGKVFDIFLDSLTKKSPTKSCGCLTSKIIRKQKTKHGECRSEMYQRWCGMKSRCYNKNDKRYDDWGGRGITVCDEWVDNYQEFEKWSRANGGLDGKKLQIDRIENNKGYSPSNCRYISNQLNSRNKRVRRTNKLGVSGVGIDKRTNRYYAAISLDNKKRISLGYFDSFFEACCARKSAENRFW